MSRGLGNFPPSSLSTDLYAETRYLFNNIDGVMELLSLQQCMKDRQEGSEVLTAVSEGYDYCNSLTRDARLRQPSSTELQRHTRVPLTNLSFCPVYIQTCHPALYKQVFFSYSIL